MISQAAKNSVFRHVGRSEDMGNLVDRIIEKYYPGGMAAILSERAANRLPASQARAALRRHAATSLAKTISSPKMKREPLTAAKKEKIVATYAVLRSSSAVARALNCGMGHVYKTLKEARMLPARGKVAA